MVGKSYSEEQVIELLRKALERQQQGERPAKEEKPPKPPKPTRKERKIQKLREQLGELEGFMPTSEASEPALHFTGKKPLQFKRTGSLIIPPEVKKKAKKLQTRFIPEAHEPELDVVTEQIEKPQTTVHSPESIKVDGVKEVKRNPEHYIEINMVTHSRVVDTFYIPADLKKFHYKTKEYQVNEDAIYLLPTRIGLFMPTCHYKEGVFKPWGFKQMNKGITGKALSLLYMEQLYTSLLYSEDLKYNLFIVILSIAILVAYGIGCYFLFVHGGGLFAPNQPVSPSELIILLRGLI